MKKTITSIAILASATSASALIGPGGPSRPAPHPKQLICLSTSELADGSQTAGTCNAVEKNTFYRAPLQENGCAKGQIAIRSATIKIASCPTYVQL